MKVPKLIKSVRYSLFAVNCLFLLTGAVLLITGVISLTAYREYELLITNRFFILPGLVIATGVIIFFAALLGFYGAISEHFYFIAGYVGLLLVILLFEISITIMGFTLREDGVSEIRSTMATSLQQYETRSDVAVIWDELQMGFQCCGVTGRNDWVSNRLPVSCCYIDYGTISPFECGTGNAYTSGCAAALGEWLGRKAFAVGVTGATVTCLQITGIIILSVGSSVQSAYNGYHEFLSERFFSLPAFCIATGVIVFLIAFAGFYGAYMENYYVTMAFAGSMILMFVFQLSACIAGYALRGNTVALVQKQLLSTMDLYGIHKSVEVTKLWDEVQTDFTCCGVVNSSDWLVPLNTTDTLGLPVSCCSHIPGTVTSFVCNTTMGYSTGCSVAFGDWVQSHAGTIGITGVFLVIMQALAVAGAVWLANITRREQEFP
ncbi:CD63 antigen-like [Aricia agestis]|uniref:CD63 antigen-like n=1 Tax=Aricia agestis TaxID=91739 RepID=UPI001C20A010|nr:CD63 antigen-like [Aricia agestis]